MIRFKSIQSALMGWFLLIALIPMGVIGWYGYHMAATSIWQMQDNELDATAESNVHLLEEWFSEIEQDVSAWAGLPAPKDSYIAILEGWRKSGLPLETYLKSPEYHQKMAYGAKALKTLHTKYDFAYDIQLIDLEGNILYSVMEEDDLGKNLRFGDLASTLFARAFRHTITEKKTYFSDLEYYGPSGKMLSGFITVPMSDDKGKLIGVMALQLKIGTLLKRLEETSGDSRIKHYLVGSDGLLRTKRGEHDILKERISTEQFWKWNREHATETAEGHPHMIEEVTNYMGPDGEMVFGKHYDIHILGVHWAHISEIAENDASASTRWLGQMIIFMTMIGAGLILIMARLLSKRITDPIIDLREASRAYEAGEENFILNIKTENEIGELASAFSDMVSKQQKTTKELAEIAESEKTKSEELAKALEVKRGILDAAGAMIVTIDTNGIIMTINKAGEEMIGYTRDELIGKETPAIFHKISEVLQRAKLLSDELEEIIAPGLEVFIAKARHGLVSTDEWTYVRKDRSEFPAYTAVNALKNQDGEIFGYLAVVTDISQIKQAQKEALRLSQVVGQSPYPTVITDLEGKIEYANEGLLEISGYRYDEVIGKNMSLFSSGKHSLFVYQSLWDRIANQKQVWHGTLIDKMKNGELRDWDSTIFPLFDAKGETVNYVSIINDVTEVNAKERLLLMQSRQAQMGEMLSMIAHQWRQPLAIINALVGKILLQEMFKEKPDEELSTILKQIEDQSLFLSRTITDFRDYFRTDKPKEQISCSQLINNAMSLIDHAIKTHSLHFTTTVNSDPMITTYENELIQVLITLVKNSLDAFDDHPVDSKNLEIIVDQEEEWAVIAIKDNAGGIKPEIISEIFSPYFTTKKGDKGTGLGLYMAKTVVEEHCGGKLDVESADGTTIFRIFLPLNNE